jgi:hypothetical protein
MSFNVGDVVRVRVPSAVHAGQLARIEQVLPKRVLLQDFQEYVVEFANVSSERFRFCLYREFELLPYIGSSVSDV